MTDPITNFAGLYERLQQVPALTIAVAAAEDDIVLQALNEAAGRGWITPVLVGQADKCKLIIAQNDLDAARFEFVDTTANLAAERAVGLVRSGDADLLMKGKTSTAELLRAVLNRDTGLVREPDPHTDVDPITQKPRVLSHVAVIESDQYDRLMLCADGGVNIEQSLPVMRDVLANTIEIAKALNIQTPHVAALALVETVNDKLPETKLARTLAEDAKSGRFGHCVVEGPLALDVALSAEAAHHKGISSRIAGKIDIFLGPNITAVNFIVKALMSIGGAQGGGIVLGATAPIVLLSRADAMQTRLNSIALALVASLYYSQHAVFGDSQQVTMDI